MIQIPSIVWNLEAVSLYLPNWISVMNVCARKSRTYFQVPHGNKMPYLCTKCTTSVIDWIHSQLRAVKNLFIPV